MVDVLVPNVLKCTQYCYLVIGGFSLYHLVDLC